MAFPLTVPVVLSGEPSSQYILQNWVSKMLRYTLIILPWGNLGIVPFHAQETGIPRTNSVSLHQGTPHTMLHVYCLKFLLPNVAQLRMQCCNTERPTCRVKSSPGTIYIDPNLEPTQLKWPQACWVETTGRSRNMAVLTNNALYTNNILF